MSYNIEKSTETIINTSDNNIPQIIIKSSGEKPVNDFVFILKSCVNYLTYLLLGSILIVTLWYVFLNGAQLSTMRLHVILCVVGYQILMAVAILSLSPENLWTSSLSLLYRRRLHWILQLSGSIIAITGSIIMMDYKVVNFDTTHGKLGLASVCFTFASLINGLTSLYSAELKQYIKPKVSKLSHILFGTITFVLSGVTLIHGFDKGTFANWSSRATADIMIGLTAVYTCLVVVSPMLTFWKRLL